MAKYIIFRLESEGTYEDRRQYIARDTCDNKLAAEAIMDKYPDAIVVYGEICNVIKKHTEIETPDI